MQSISRKTSSYFFGSLFNFLKSVPGGRKHFFKVKSSRRRNLYLKRRISLIGVNSSIPYPLVLLVSRPVKYFSIRSVLHKSHLFVRTTWTVLKMSSIKYVMKKIVSSIVALFTFTPKDKEDTKKLYFSKYYYVGLGYKLFVLKNLLFVWVGFTHYSLIRIPSGITIYPKKKRIYLVGERKFDFSNFYAVVRRIRERDIYKAKGLLEVKSYKNFIRMKTSKKKQ